MTAHPVRDGPHADFRQEQTGVLVFRAHLADIGRGAAGEFVQVVIHELIPVARTPRAGSRNRASSYRRKRPDPAWNLASTPGLRGHRLRASTNMSPSRAGSYSACPAKRQNSARARTSRRQRPLRERCPACPLVWTPLLARAMRRDRRAPRELSRTTHARRVSNEETAR